MGGKAAVGVCVGIVVALGLATAALGNHGATSQSTCLRSKQPDGSVVSQSLASSDPNGLNCGQWICNAPVVSGGFSTPKPCVTPPLTMNATSGDTIAVRPITFPAGEWTMTIVMTNADTGADAPAAIWNSADAGAERLFENSGHWKVKSMSVTGDLNVNGAFELWFGDPIPA